MQAITWLHLSDLHMNSFRPEYERDRVISTLLKDLSRLADSEPRPDLIFFTGDLAFGQTPEEGIKHQFDMGFDFLTRVRSVWKPPVTKANVFLVPGNHDVRRDFATEAITQFLNSTTDVIRLAALMKKADKQWGQVVERLRPYREALDRHGYSHLLQNTTSLSYSHKRAFGKWSVQICGMNTAWSCVADREKGKLWLCGRFQIAELLKSKVAPIAICLMHHPTGWFREEEAIPELDRIFQSSFRFLLHGHEHDEWVQSIDSHTRVAAGAAYGGDATDNGYNLTTFYPESGETLIRLRRYERKGREWIQNIIAGKTDEEGNWHLPGKNITAQHSSSSELMSPPASDRPHLWDAFFAAPMAALAPAEYKRQRKDLRRVVSTLRRSWGGIKVYYPSEQIPATAEWDPPDMAMKRGLKAIAESRIFIMIYNVERPSSVLVEAGFALAHRIPSLYFVKSGLQLPFLLNAANQSEAAQVKVYEYARYEDIVKFLKEYRHELIGFMRDSKSATLARRRVIGKS